nr:MAG TPA: hypothetical protein [Caudoviricetes sp.]DAX77928.1 MAG TPA: hypothetical protein [Caudoviricetes sp.]
MFLEISKNRKNHNILSYSQLDIDMNSKPHTILNMQVQTQVNNFLHNLF